MTSVGEAADPAIGSELACGRHWIDIVASRQNSGSAGVAQLVERRFCKPQVVGSIPTPGSIRVLAANLASETTADSDRRPLEKFAGHCSTEHRRKEATAENRQPE